MQQIREKLKKEWKKYKVKELGCLYGGLTGKNKDDFGEGKKFIPYMNVFRNSRIDVENMSLVKIDGKERQNKAVYGDIFFTGSSETPEDVGMSSVLLDESEEDVFLNSFCFGLRLNSFDVLMPEFARFLFRSPDLRKKISLLAQGSTRFNLSKKHFLDINLSLPSLNEQKKIAKILLRVDEDIENVGKTIKQTIKLKNGLMQGLLTKGIGHKKFKKTKLGIIPEEWDIALLDSVAKRGSGHTPSKSKPNYWNGGIKWVSLADSSELDNRYICSTDKEISEDGIKNSSAVLHPAGTVILSRDAGVGKSAVLSCEMAVSQHFIGWQCGDSLSNFYLYYLFQNWKSEFERIATGTTIKTIGLQFFKDLKVPLPSYKEQKKIADILTRVDDKIDVYKSIKSKLEILKKGLMQDLFVSD
ncbi:MAG: restriction endonuclease subunit S [Candidatus Moraniibacteriota bacterium]